MSAAYQQANPYLRPIQPPVAEQREEPPPLAAAAAAEASGTVNSTK